jgi:phospholipid-translocating ATPase
MLAAAERFFPQSGLLQNEDVLRSNTGEGLARVNTNRLARVYTGISDIVGPENGERPGGFVLVIDGLGLDQVRR